MIFCLLVSATPADERKAMAKIITMPESGDLLPDPQVAQRYKISTRTLARWDNQPELGFPPPVRINNRKYRHVRALEEFERARVADKAR